jgi:hypoxanthine phosphoribosyltransferase
VPFADHPELGKVIVPADAIARRVRELGHEIAAAYPESRPVLVGILKGAFIFLADLARAIPVPVEYDVMAVSSYGDATVSSGAVRVVKDLDIDIAGRHVVLVEDIVDSGLTLRCLRELLLAREPASLDVCALTVRASAADLGWIRWIGFRISDDWVVGYGLDTAEKWRNLADIRAWVGR